MPRLIINQDIDIFMVFVGVQHAVSCHFCHCSIWKDPHSILEFCQWWTKPVYFNISFLFFQIHCYYSHRCPELVISSQSTKNIWFSFPVILSFYCFYPQCFCFRDREFQIDDTCITPTIIDIISESIKTTLTRMFYSVKYFHSTDQS